MMRAATPEDLFGGINFEDIFGNHDFGFGGSIFDRFFRRRTGPAPGANLEIALEIPFERVVSGGEETFSFPRMVTCPTCHGSRADPASPPRQCLTCAGSGRKTTSKRQDGVTLQQISTCPDCQ